MRKQTALWTTKDGHKIRICDMFWDEFSMPSLPKPKQKVKRNVEGFINIYRVRGSLIVENTIYSSQSNATDKIGCIAGEFIVTVPISFTFEQEG